MSLHEFEHVLDKLDVDFLHFRVDGYIEAQLASEVYDSVFYTYLAKEEQGGNLSISCFIPRGEAKIKNVDKLLTLLKNSEKEVLVEFDQDFNGFSIATHLSPGSHEDEFKQFQHDCDRVFPALYEISMQGQWSARFVGMALLATDAMPQA